MNLFFGPAISKLHVQPATWESGRAFVYLARVGVEFRPDPAEQVISSMRELEILGIYPHSPLPRIELYWKTTFRDGRMLALDAADVTWDTMPTDPTRIDFALITIDDDSGVEVPAGLVTTGGFPFHCSDTRGGGVTITWSRKGLIRLRPQDECELCSRGRAHEGEDTFDGHQLGAL